MRIHRKLDRGALQQRGNYSASELAAVLLVVVAGIVIIILFMSIQGNIDNAEEQACAAQVRAAAATNSIFGREYQADMPACQTKYITIELNTVKREVHSTDPEKLRTEVKHILAEEMRKCWDQWGQGELELFQTSGQYCSFCTNIGFDQKTQELFGDTKGVITDFHTYLEKEKSPSGVSYDEHFTGSPINIPEVAPIDQNNFALSTDKNLTVVFFYDKSLVRTTWWQSYLSWQEGRDVGADEATENAQGTIFQAIIGGAFLKGATTVRAAVGEAQWITSNAALVSRVPGATSGTAEVLARNVMVTGVKKGASQSIGGTIGRYLFNFKPIAGATALMYTHMRLVEQYGVVSAIYITRLDSNAPYVTDCTQMAEATRSP